MENLELWKKVFDIFLSKGDVYSYDYKAAVKEIEESGITISPKPSPDTVGEESNARHQEIAETNWVDKYVASSEWEEIARESFRAGIKYRENHGGWRQKWLTKTTELRDRVHKIGNENEELKEQLYSPNPTPCTG